MTQPNASRPNPNVAIGKFGPALEDAQKIDGFPTLRVVMPNDFRALFNSQASKVSDTPVNGLITLVYLVSEYLGLAALNQDSMESISFNCICWPRGKDPANRPLFTSLKSNFTLKGSTFGRPEKLSKLGFPTWRLTHVTLSYNASARGSRYCTVRRSTSLQYLIAKVTPDFSQTR